MEANSQQIAAFIVAALDHGCKYVHLKFSGGGDSGDLDSYSLVPESILTFEEDEEGNITGEDWKHYEYEQAYKDIMVNECAGAPKMTREIAYAFFQMLHEPIHEHDWWNNDGGSGSATIDLQTKRYFVAHDVYFTASESHSSSGVMQPQEEQA